MLPHRFCSGCASATTTVQSKARHELSTSGSHGAPPLSHPPLLTFPDFLNAPWAGAHRLQHARLNPALAVSGAISEPQVVAQFLALLAGGLGVSYTLDRWAGHEFPILLCLAIFGSFISYIYSAPPLKLKQSGWIGNYALGSSYIALPWWAGQVCCTDTTSPQYG